jgi:hypothetical protein
MTRFLHEENTRKWPAPFQRLAERNQNLAEGDAEEEDRRMNAAAEYYREMRAALDETDFRWLQLGEKQPAQNTMRRNRVEIYTRYRKLFVLEIAGSCRAKQTASSDRWSARAFELLRYRAMLSLASLLFRYAIPGALDVCDAAVFGMIRIAWLQTAPILP